MKRFILTGTPGAGKTTILRHLHARGFATVEEAATDVITREQARGRPEPWMQEEFIDKIVTLQRRRQTRPPAPAFDCVTTSTAAPTTVPTTAPTTAPATPVQIFDRSPVCTHALSVFLGREPTALLRSELERITRDAVYETRVFFIGNLGFCEPTSVRRISYEDSLLFEQVHRDSYRAFGYQLIDIPPAPPADRAAAIIDFLTLPA